MEGQVAVLQKAHSMLSSHLELDSWAELWAAADGQQGFDPTTSHVSHAVTAHVIDDLLPNFAFCEPTQRFTRLVSHLSVQCHLPAPCCLRNCFLIHDFSLHVFLTALSAMYRPIPNVFNKIACSSVSTLA